MPGSKVLGLFQVALHRCLDADKSCQLRLGVTIKGVFGRVIDCQSHDIPECGRGGRRPPAPMSGPPRR